MGEDEKKVMWYPFASIMGPMKPSMKVPPNSEVDAGCEACDRAFALVCRYSKGWDLVEEMVASKCWPLGKIRPSMKIEMVKLLVFGEEGRVPSPALIRSFQWMRTLKFLLVSSRRRCERFLVIFLIRNI